jgi:hypothetical protein
MGLAEEEGEGNNVDEAQNKGKKDGGVVKLSIALPVLN